MTGRFTVFLDRDGVLNRAAAPGDYITSVSGLELLDGVGEAIRLLNRADVRVLVVTNQRGIARGLMDAADLERIHHELIVQLRGDGAKLDGIYHCPHADGACECRKPAVGMFLQARREHPDIDFRRSVVIGDSVTDMVAARRIGARGILIGDAHAEGCERAGTLLEAVRRLLPDQPSETALARASARPSGVPTSITDSPSR